MFCNCLHTEESHHADGCHALHRDGEGLVRCWCRRSRQRVAEGPDHLKDALRLAMRSEEHTSELQSRQYLVCRLLLEKKKKKKNETHLVLERPQHTRPS